MILMPKQARQSPFGFYSMGGKSEHPQPLADKKVAANSRRRQR